MKKTFLIVAVFAFLSVSASKNTTILKGEKAAEKVANSEMLRLKHFTAVPNFVKFRTGKELPLEKLRNWLNQFYTSDAQYGVKLIGKEVGSLGMTHYRYQQTVNGIPLELSAFLAHVKNGKVQSVNGDFFSEVNVSTSNTITESGALNAALSYIGAEVYKWQIEEEEAHLKWEQKDPSATYFPKGEKVLINTGGLIDAPLKLAYKFNVYAQVPHSRRDIFVDAKTGEIIWEQTKIHHADVTGSATTAYSGVKPIVTDDNGGTFRLRESGRGNGIETYDMNMGINYGAATDFTDADNNWNNVNADLDQYATDAHWGAEMTYDYFLNIHGRNSIDGNGFKLRSYVHFDLVENGGASQNNAFWDGQRMTYGDGQGGLTPLTSIDIAGHEITHGLTSNTANLVYQDESGALNESFSDIFGLSVDWFSRPSAANWTMGEEIGATFRSMADPNAYGDPDTYFGTDWQPLGGADNGGVHSNSGVQNFWYYLLVNGGTGTNDNMDNYTVNGLGLTRAEKISFRNLTVYLTPSSNYSDARFYAIQSATDLYGGCSDEVQEVTNAWYAVGVGQEYVDFTLSNFDTPIDSSCIVPFTANFNNLSLNGVTYMWDFGDGNSSTQANPANTYNNFGTYNVELIAIGAPNCGNDTTVKTAFIVLYDSLPCISNMPVTGIGVSQTACTGTLYDSGGATGNYGANQDSRITISPVGAATIDLTFVSFDVEAGSNNNCDYDFLSVYDGPDISSPLIGKYCNDNIPTTVSSTVGAVTIVFHSDGGLETAGFHMDWQCNLVAQAPSVNFSNSVDISCGEKILFTDNSTNSPSSWLWDFGDGNSSSQQNPEHTYLASGTYTVELTASNAIGGNTLTKADLIVVDYPISPIAQGDSICENEQANLTASGAGTLNWYAASSGGTSIAGGTAYTTPALTSSTTYYVEDVITSPTQFLGKTDDSGSGGNFNSQQHLYFDVYQAMEILSVKVYAATAGIRIIHLRDNLGTVLGTKVVNLAGTGEEVVALNFLVDPGTGFELGLSTGTPNIDLYRSNGGINYPYEIAGLASITNSSANQNNGLNHYYFFYDWNVKELDCISLRTPVAVQVDVCTAVDELNESTNISSFLNSLGALEINFLNLEGDYNLSISNSLGQIVLTEKLNVNSAKQKENIDINQLAKGLYYVNIYNEKNQHTLKIVK